MLQNSEATFVSKEVKKNGEGLDITGDLTLNGVMHPVTLDAKLIGKGDDPWGNAQVLKQPAISTLKTLISPPTLTGLAGR
jgi:polyisoprenoid-binding protein YceI